MTQVTLESLNAEEALEMGTAAHHASQFAIAERLYRHAIARQPDLAGARLGLGLILRGTDRVAKALAMLQAAYDLDPAAPKARHALGMAHLTLGDYRAGWPLFEARLTDNPQTPNLAAPMWRGEPLAGKRLAIFPEQGLGDSIQIARFAPLLRDQGVQVVLLCQPSLVSIFEVSFPGVEVRAAVGSVDLGDLDYWVMTMSIPGRLNLGLQDIPAAAYLSARGSRPLSPHTLRLGLTTRGNPNHQNDARRSLSAEHAARLRAMPGVELVSLHPEDSGARDFLETADIISGLDLVVSIDSAACHLSGAMGKPTLLLLPGFGVDWRWMTGRDDSPWYPNHRLFRGTVDGDWSVALTGVEQTVEALRTAKAASGQ